METLAYPHLSIRKEVPLSVAVRLCGRLPWRCSADNRFSALELPEPGGGPIRRNNQAVPAGTPADRLGPWLWPSWGASTLAALRGRYYPRARR